MKKYIYIFSMLSINFLFAQTASEQLKIINTYDKDKIEVLIDDIESYELSKESRVATFLNNNKNISREFSVDSVKYRVYDIIEGKPIFISTDNLASSIASRTNRLNSGGSTGLNLDGENMNIGVWDGGHVLSTHIEFQISSANMATRVAKPDTFTGNTNSDFHATHVAGTIGSRGQNNSSKGMAPKSNILSYDWTNDASEVVSAVTNNALLISNHSYGTPIYSEGVLAVPSWYMGCYSDVAKAWDQIMHTYPYYLMVASAGNSGMESYDGGLAAGYDKLTGNKNSKNALIVANANPTIHPISGNITALNLNAGSSQGPTDDGRIKPDIAADGTQLYSTFNTNNTSYEVLSGTSMSSPTVAGSLLLLQEYYNRLNSTYMLSSTLKAIVCHTAKDDEVAGPDSRFGWGLLDTQAAANIITENEDNNALISELLLSDGDSYTFNFSASGTETLKATICWTDVDGPQKNGLLNSPDPVLVNDLDLRLTKDGTTYLPWKLQLDNLNGGAIKGDNIVDNIEVVEILAPETGQYTLTISHKGNLVNGNQSYSLILTGSDLVLSNTDIDFENQVKIWPNPASNMLNISFQNIIDKTNITLYDIQGREVYTQSIDQYSQNKHHINTSDFSSGMYLLKINVGNQILNKKIIIE